MFQVDKEKCIGCEACINVCPQGAIYPDTKLQQSFSPNKGQIFPNPGFGIGRGPRDGRGRGRGGGGRRD